MEKSLKFYDSKRFAKGNIVEDALSATFDTSEKSLKRANKMHDKTLKLITARDNPNIKKPKLPINEENIIVFAFRYALGRNTTAPAIVIEQLNKNWELLRTRTKGQIISDINNYLIKYGTSGVADCLLWDEFLNKINE